MTARPAASSAPQSAAFVPMLSRGEVRLPCKSASYALISATGVQNNVARMIWTTVSAAPSLAGGVLMHAALWEIESCPFESNNNRMHKS